MELPSYLIGIDTGGTFTDVTVLTPAGEVVIEKAPTTPRDFSRGIMEALRRAAEAVGVGLRELLERCSLFKHGSTVATNALITREGARVGLITTRGFEDSTLIMRAIGRVAGLSEEEIKHQATAVKPEPLVPRARIRGVTERIDFRGRVVIPLNLEEARQALQDLIEGEGIEALAVNFLWGFVNPSHEQAIKALVAREYPDRDLFLSLASEICPVVREYARSNTVILNAFLGCRVQGYVEALERKLRAAGYLRPSLIMQANGGAVHREEMVPIGTLGSGPSGGMIASKAMADALGHRHVITTDMGGTSFDVGLLVDGYWRYQRDPVVERFHVSWPMIDIHSIGAGGGTVAWIDPVTNRLRLGPRSAGADPGPVCYDAGGTEPTVTDTDLLLGYLDPDYFLGGRMRLNRARAERAIWERIGQPLGMDVIEAAAGIYEIINGHMSDLIRKQVVTTGALPKEFALYTFGGAGPVHAAAFARDLGVGEIYVFPASAVFSSFGVAAADVVHTRTASARHPLPTDPEVLSQQLGRMEEALLRVMAREGFREEQVSFRRTFLMRYRRQVNELEVEAPTGRYTEAEVRAVMERFERRYEEVYGTGSAYRDAGMEVISFRVDAIGPTTKPALKAYPPGSPRPPSDARKGSRQAFFPAEKDFCLTAVYEYGRLQPGNRLEGPAIVETPVTTVVIPPGAETQVDQYLNLSLRWVG
ncbi:MAG: hydantoinase/oxoprolinase family protein [Deltaproteobacteria bacterium]|nr:hydantoinase/oxoprolinase family protein [Deltaproteobacteria bacterium]